MRKNKNGFVVSAVLYPLLVLFLALIMGLLAMTDTRKRILDKMKLEISDSIFDDAECSCDTILNKLNYLIKNGVGGGGNGSYGFNVLGLNVKGYESPNMFPNTGNAVGDIAVLTDTEVTDYYVSRTAPGSPKEGNVWIVQDITSAYYIQSDYSKIGVSYVMQYIDGKWILKKAYVYDEQHWKLLYYVPVKDGVVDLTGSDINAETEWKYDYTGEYQTFTARFSGYYQVELWGAQGGTNNTSYPGGKGSYTSGEVYLDAGENLYVYVGGTTTTPSGGWNGGGDGVSKASGSAGGGGGATDVRLVNTSEKNIWNEFESLKSRIMVAAGGGGGTYYNVTYWGSGGAGGGLTGYTGTANDASPGTGASHTFGGRSFYNTDSILTTLGGFGYGGIAYPTWSAGGGSSYISGHEGCNSLYETSTNSNLIFSGKEVHYSNHYFINTTMIDGQSYSWTSVKQSRTDMPTYNDDATMVGNSGNGYAKITLKTVEVIDQNNKKKLQQENEKVWNFTFSNNYQALDIERSGIYQIALWGAPGGTNNATYPGGKGSYTEGRIYLEKGTRLYLYVGGTPLFTKGGFNGGGDGVSNVYGSAGGGGGATDIRLYSGNWDNFESLKSRIMVAAGGGGGTYYSGEHWGSGGAGGGLTGYTGTANNAFPGTGGQTNSAGTSYYNLTASQTSVGNFGYGGMAYPNWSAGGGGGGYYGGGGGSYAGAGAGGGSSYISGHEGCNSIAEDSTVTNIIHNGSAYHYSGYYFTNTQMIDGSGYSWSLSKQSKTNMPMINTTENMTGNSGNGHAKVILLEEKTQNEDTIISIQSENEKTWSYQANGAIQVFQVSKSGTYKFELWGAQGGTNNTSYPGGKGSYVSGNIHLDTGANLYVAVGKTMIPSNTVQGGWNGGGDGVSNASGSAGGGGGSTDIRINNTSKLVIWNEVESLKSRIMVAAGGGGGTYYAGTYWGSGGAGGGLTGYTGTANDAYPGTGGTQTIGGFSSYNASAKEITIGGFGYGGNYYPGWSAAGGGGGYYGGGGGSYAGAGAGGGSSYISGHAGCIAIDSNGNPKVQTYSTLSDSISYTGYKFTNTQMIDGNGYPWTTEKATSSSGMPTQTGESTMTGNTGDGYVKITYLGA